MAGCSQPLIVARKTAPRRSTAAKNAFVERFNRSFRTEVLDACLFNAVSEVQGAADHWLTDYNEFRPHESLGDVPPAVFKPRVFNADVSTSVLST
ncbi:integrase core domain-containing protein [Stenotrophomonas maltophilia]|uniref:integrase core domain-containing protein n=1 Tax=Stenotrophomonas maltophilia TaxID=40324 RepID=UPI002AB2F706|nr:transposase [Stenotrophomonas maltophilia]MCF3519479.1 transposase [Stenotrophomonas maltophilia]